MSISEEAISPNGRPAAHHTSISAGAKCCCNYYHCHGRHKWHSPGDYSQALAHSHGNADTHTQLLVVTWLSGCSIAVLHSATCRRLRTFRFRREHNRA